MDFDAISEFVDLFIIFVLILIPLIIIKRSKIKNKNLYKIILILFSSLLIYHFLNKNQYISSKLSRDDVIGKYFIEIDDFLLDNVDSNILDSIHDYYIEFKNDSTFLIPDCVLFDSDTIGNHEIGAKSWVGSGTWRVFKNGGTNISLLYDKNENSYYTGLRIDKRFRTIYTLIKTEIFYKSNDYYDDYLIKLVKKRHPTYNIKQLGFSSLRGFDSRFSILVGRQECSPKTQLFHIVKRYQQAKQTASVNIPSRK